MGVVAFTVPILSRISHNTALMDLFLDMDRDFQLDQLLIADRYKNGVLKLVQLHKERFGTQDGCTRDSQNKLHYWWFTDSGCVVYVNNHHGIDFQVPASMTAEEAFDAWQRYRSQVVCLIGDEDGGDPDWVS